MSFSKKALDKMKRRKHIVPNWYLDMSEIIKYWDGSQRVYHHTAPIYMMYALYQSLYDVLEEGIDNHFTVTVPGHNDRYFFLPFGLHWSEARASDLIIFSEDGHLFEGSKGDLELSAQVIHAPIHRITGAKVVMHTHQHWALALNMLEDNKLISANQTSAIYFENQVAYDDDYTGAATTLSEGERLCSALGDKHTLFMKNHGVLVVGSTVAEAYHRLYLLERVCRVQVLAMATGKTIVPIPKETID